MTSATDELHLMLDERGVKHKDEDTALDTHGTLYRVTTTADWVYEEPPSCDLLVRSRYDIGAEQAVEATLGRGECRNTTPSYLDFLCSECGFVHYHSDENDSGGGNEWRFCPNCGRRVEQ